MKQKQALKRGVDAESFIDRKSRLPTQVTKANELRANLGAGLDLAGELGQMEVAGQTGTDENFRLNKSLIGPT